MKKASPDLQNITWFNQYATAIKVVIGAMATFIVTTWGVFEYVDRKADKEKTVDENITLVLNNQQEFTAWMRLVDKRLDSLIRTVEGQGENLIHVGNYVMRVDQAVRYTVRSMEDKSLERYARIIEILEGEEKKNDSRTALMPDCK
jgi:hypothetical protein